MPADRYREIKHVVHSRTTIFILCSSRMDLSVSRIRRKHCGAK